MAENSTPVLKTTSVTVGESAPAAYKPLNAQEAKAAEIAAQARSENGAPSSYKGAVSGTEGTAKEIVDATRTTDTTTSKQVADKGLDLMDAQGLDAISPAAGMPFAGKASPEALNAMTLGTADIASHTLAKPNAKKTTTIAVQPGEVLAAQFDPDSASLSVRGKNLVIDFEDGSQIVLKDFAADAQNMPSISLPNGALVSGGVIIAQLQGTNAELFNLETAAGGEGGDGGNFIYDDNLGNVIDLLSKLPPIPFTELQFPQSETEDFTPVDDIGGTFINRFDTIGGQFGPVAGGFEDWKQSKHIGDHTVTPMQLHIDFTPKTTEVVDEFSILNVPAGVTFFYSDDGGATLNAFPPGNIVMTGAQFNSWTLYALQDNFSDVDIPMTLRMLISKPGTTLTAVISQNTKAVIDAVADQPEDILTSTISVSGNTSNGSVSGKKGDPIDFNLKVHFPDQDGSETHTVMLENVPDVWTMAGDGGLVWNAVDNLDGTMTYTATVLTGDVDTTVTFDGHGWDGTTGSIVFRAIAEETVTDGELVLENNISEVATEFAVTLRDDQPMIISVAKPVIIPEADLLIPGVDSVDGQIVVDFFGDGPGTVEMTLDGLNALGLTSNGQTIAYELSPDGQLITATIDGGTTTVFTFALGTLVATGNGSEESMNYTFTLFEPLDHAPGAGANNIDIPVQIIARDNDGDEVTGELQARVIDDLPTAEDDSYTVDESDMANAIVNGSVHVDFGADGPAAGTAIEGNNSYNNSLGVNNLFSGGHLVTVALVGDTYVGTANGQTVFTMQINNDGTYRFELLKTLDHPDGSNPDDAIDLSFGYKATDYDGDVADGTIHITVKDDGPTAGPGFHATDETTELGVPFPGNVAFSFGEDGAGSVAPDNNFTPGGSLLGGTLTSNGATVDVALVGNKYVGTINGGVTEVFTMQINSDGTFEFIQKEPLDHADGNDINDIINLGFGYTVTDGDSDTASHVVTIQIRDDAPIAFDDTAHIPDGSTVATGNVMDNDTMSVDGPNLIQDITFGATTKSFTTPDGTDAGGNFVTIAGAYGTLKIYEDGEYTYTYDAHLHSGNLSEVFHYTLVDYDGDTDTAKLTLSIVDDVPGQAPNVVQVVDETDDIGTTMTYPAIVVDGATQFALGDVGGNATFSSSGSQTGGNLTSNGWPVTVALVGGKYVGTANGAEIFTLEIDNSGVYKFTLKGVLDHADGDDINDVINLHFNYTARDADGDASEGTIEIRVLDDAPIANDDHNTMAPGDTIATGNVITGEGADDPIISADDVGADTDGKLTQVTFGSETKTFDADGIVDGGGKYVTINGDYGTLKIYEDGEYTYTLTSPPAPSGSFSFTATPDDIPNATTQSITEGGITISAKSGYLTYVTANDHPEIPPQSGIGIKTAGDGSNKVWLQNETLVIEYDRGVTATNITVSDIDKNNEGAGFDFKIWFADGTGPVAVELLAPNPYPADGHHTFTLDSANFGGKEILKVELASTTSQGDATNKAASFMLAAVDATYPGEGLCVDKFEYTLSDYDTDTDTAILSFCIEDTGAAPQITVQTGDGAVQVAFDRFNLPEDALMFPLLTERQNISDVYNSAQVDKLIDTANAMQIDFPTLVSVELVKADHKVASYKNGLGAFTLHQDGSISNVKLLFGNATSNDDHPLSGDDLKATYDMTSDSGRVVFFIVQNGHSSLQGAGLSDADGRALHSKELFMEEQGNGSLKLYYMDGGNKVFINHTIYASEQSFNDDGQFHTIAGVGPVNTNDAAMFGFEDLTGPGGGGSDRDFNDVMFTVTVQPRAEITLVQDQLITHFDIVDADSTHMSEALVVVSNTKTGDALDFALGGGYTLVGNNVFKDGSDIGIDATITQTIGGDFEVHMVGNASSAHYESLVKMIHFTSTGVDPMSAIGVRDIAITVTDDQGNSTTLTTDYVVTPPSHFDIQVAGSTTGDTLTGTGAQDLLLGREGDDTLVGGEGNDILAGGSGNDTLIGGAGADTFLFHKNETGVDTIMDYSLDEGDRLDISDLLAGSGYQPGVSVVDNYVKVDNTTGQVFVDTSGAGSFDATNHIATINNIGAVDALNIILNDAEGNKVITTS